MATNQGTRIWDVNAEASLTGIEKIPMGKGGSAPAVTTVNKLKTFINADRAPVLDLSTMSAGKSLSNNSGEYRFVYNGNPTHSVIVKYNSKLYEIVCCNHSDDNIGTYYYCFEGKNCTNVWTEVTLPDWVKECMFEYVAKRIANMSENIVIIEQNISAHKSEIGELVQETTKQPKYSSLPMLAGQPSILFGAGTPQEAIVPDNWQQFDPETGEGYNWTGVPSAIGQQYINTTATTGGRYIAVRDGYYGLKWLNC